MQALGLPCNEPLVKDYGKHLADTTRSTPLSESKAPNFSSPAVVVWQEDRSVSPETPSRSGYNSEPYWPRTVTEGYKTLWRLMHAHGGPRTSPSCSIALITLSASGPTA
jgi:hypothetical protein